MQYRLSTLLLAFVVVWSSLAVFGMAGLVVAAILLAIAAFYRSPALKKPPLLGWLAFLIAAFLLVLLALASHSARESSSRFQCMNYLKQIGLALDSYEAQNGRLPPAVVADKQGHAMHSWRTLILPYLDRDDVFRAYDFGEPWNGPNNSKLATKVLPFFCCWSDRSTFGRPVTSYVAVTGPGTVWDDRRSAGTPPRVMVVEVANSNINWMQPRDLTLEQACRGVGDGSGPGISGRHTIADGFFFRNEVSGAHALYSDGSVVLLPAGLPPETLRGLFTGDEKAKKACEAFQPVCHHCIHWANCTAMAVLLLSYAVLLLRPRDKRPPAVYPAIPSSPAAAGGK